MHFVLDMHVVHALPLLPMNEDTTATEKQEEVVQTSLRIPVSLQKTIAHEAIDRGVTVSQLWLQAMRQYLNLKDAA